jgi:hypothetical protein
MRALLLCSVLLLGSVLVHAREFDTQGLELLANRYGNPYPGYGLGVAGLNNVPQFGADVNIMPFNNNNLQQLDQLGFGAQQQQNPELPAEFGGEDNLNQGFSAGVGAVNLPLNFGQAGVNWGGVGLGTANAGFSGAMGYAALAAGSKKGSTTVAAPIYAQSMIVPKIITQPIFRPHLVQQPIIQTQYIQQPIVETRQVIQPVIRRIITQPIIQPQVYDSTTIQPTLKQETIVQPHLIEQTVVTPTMTNTMEEQAPIQAQATVQQSKPQVQPTVNAKKGHTGLGF